MIVHEQILAIGVLFFAVNIKLDMAAFLAQ